MEIQEWQRTVPQGKGGEPMGGSTEHSVSKLAQSHDLKPNKNLWQKLGMEISKKEPTSKRELIKKII